MFKATKSFQRQKKRQKVKDELVSTITLNYDQYFFMKLSRKLFREQQPGFFISRLFHLLWQGPNHQKSQILEMLPWKRYIPMNPWVNELMSPSTHESMSPWALEPSRPWAMNLWPQKTMSPRDHEPVILYISIVLPSINFWNIMISEEVFLVGNHFSGEGLF